ncbi:hypothetical protein MKW98_025039, partial [Papaver atlanticum]
PGEDVKDALVYGWDSIRNEERRRIAKIRCLLGLQDGSTSSAPPLDDIRMPESRLREDDVSYENMKASVEKCYDLPSFEGKGHVVHRFLFLLDSNDILQDVKKHLRSIIKSMSCTGLLRFANIVIGGSVSFEKTRFKMSKIILEHLKKIPQNPKHRNHKRFIEEVPILLKNPSNFKITSDVQVVDPAYLSHYSAEMKIEESIKEMNRQLLFAMLRRLKGEVKEPKFGDTLEIECKNQPRLVKIVEKLFKEERGKVRAGGELPIRLAKAMSVAVLGLNMKLDDPKIYNPEFCGSEGYKKEIKGDLLRCIRILNDTKLKVLADNTVKELRTILDPISDPIVKPQKFQDAVKRWLIENLFEYSEFGKIPDSLKKTVNIIKKAHHEREEANKEVEIVEDLGADDRKIVHQKREQANKEVEIVGDLSAQYKQIMLDKICDHNMDDDYNDACFKDLEVGSFREYANLLKDGDDHSDESVGECEADGSVLPESTSGENIFRPEDVGQDSSDGAGQEQKLVNKYLTIQETCDERSLGAHSLIGRILEKLLDEEGAELDASKRLYLRGGRSDHQEDCAANSKKKDRSTRLPVNKKRKLQGIVSTEDGLKKRKKK